MIEFRLRDRLKNAVAISAIVGDRVHPVRVPRMLLESDTGGPKLTYRRLSGGRDHYLSGASGHPNAQFEITAWSRSYDEAKALATAVRNTLDGYGPGDLGDVNVRSIRNIDEEDMFWEPDDGSDIGWYAVQLKYGIIYSESIPTPV